MSHVDEVLATGLPDGWRGRATGPLAVVHDMVEAIQRTQVRSFASAALAVWLLVTLYFRSPGAGLLAMVPTLLPVLWTLGGMGYAGRPLDVGSAMVAAVVLGIAVDDAIHLIVPFRRGRAAGDSVADAVHAAVRMSGRAIVSTSLALAAGFAALALSPWQSIASFGLVASVAIVLALLATVVVLPALLVAISREGPSRPGPSQAECPVVRIEDGRSESRR
jgi:hypothetical protein